jgi:enoyl-CoA hydratase
MTSASPLEKLVLTTPDRGIARIVLNRPDALNAMNPALLAQLLAALEKIGADSTIRAAIITGAGEKAFSAGADIAFLHEAAPLEVRRFASLAVAITRRIETLGKPVIAAINGFALGGGLEIAEACAIRIAARPAMLGHPEVQIGAIAGFGGTTRLPRLVGKGIAAELLLTGRVIDAERAREIGLINRVTEPADLMREAEALAREIASHDADAIALTWEALHRGLNLTLEESAQLGADFFGLVASSPAFRAQTRRWLERTHREPARACTP